MIINGKEKALVWNDVREIQFHQAVSLFPSKKNCAFCRAYKMYEVEIVTYNYVYSDLKEFWNSLNYC